MHIVPVANWRGWIWDLSNNILSYCGELKTSRDEDMLMDGYFKWMYFDSVRTRPPECANNKVELADHLTTCLSSVRCFVVS